MSETSTVDRRIIGALVGLLTGGSALGALAAALAYRYEDSEDSDYALLALFFFGGLGLLIGAVLGAAAGAAITQKLLNQRSSFWRALLGAAVGLPAGALVAGVAVGLPGPVPMSWAAVIIVPASIVAGAVLGSGWKAKPAKVTDP